jgi:hypothetical protein
MLDSKQLNSIPVCSDALELVPEAFAREQCVLAVSIDNGSLHIIAPSGIDELDSTEQSGLDLIRFVLNRDFTHEVALKVDLSPVVDLHYWATYSNIRNCDVTFQTRCPKQWAELAATDQNTIRYCNECDQNVYFCHSVEELKRRTANQQCVAFCDADSHHDTLGLPMEIPNL